MLQEVVHHDPVTAEKTNKTCFEALSKLRKFHKHELSLLGCLLCLQVPKIHMHSYRTAIASNNLHQIPGSLMRMYACLLCNRCKVLFAPCHLSLCALPPQGLHNGQTQINLLFKIGWVIHEHLCFQSRSIVSQNQPSWMKAVLLKTA